MNQSFSHEKEHEQMVQVRKLKNDLTAAKEQLKGFQFSNSFKFNPANDQPDEYDNKYLNWRENLQKLLRAVSNVMDVQKPYQLFEEGLLNQNIRKRLVKEIEFKKAMATFEQALVSALQSVDEEITQLESQKRKETRSTAAMGKLKIFFFAWKKSRNYR